MPSKPIPEPQLRVPPHNLEAEQALLCSMFLDPRLTTRVQDALSPSDFYREAHGHICEACFTFRDGTDPATVKQWLQDRELLERSGGMDYLMQLYQVASTAAAWEYHAKIIRDLAIRRKIIQDCATAMEHAYGPWEDNESILSGLKHAIRAVESTGATECLTPAELCNQVFDEISTRHESKNPFVGIKTGLDNLDYKCWGLEPATTIYLIARPSIGKTALALNIADHVAQNYETVLYYSLESSAKALTRRRLAAQSGVTLTGLRTANMADEEWDLLKDGLDRVSTNQRLIILDSPKLKKIESLTASATNYAMDRKVSLIVIDHIQLMSAKTRYPNRHQEISYVSQEIQSLSKELSLPIIVLCQLSRWVEQEKIKRPQLSAMKESGDLEQNADQVWSLYRETKESELAWVDCLKGRDTGTWTAKLMFKRQVQRFFDVTEDQAEKEPIEEHERGFSG